MKVKLSWHELSGPAWASPQSEIKIGTQVCKTNNRKILGKIVDKSAPVKDLHGEPRVEEVKVFWQLGSKKGKCEFESVTALINYDSYRKEVDEEVQEMIDNEALAAKTGM